MALDRERTSFSDTQTLMSNTDSCVETHINLFIHNTNTMKCHT
jgi:hypothetical protein